MVTIIHGMNKREKIVARVTAMAVQEMRAKKCCPMTFYFRRSPHKMNIEGGD